MTISAFPRRWAGNTTFSGGAHAGEATRVDPGAAVAGNGFYPDLGFAAEHANHQLGSMSDAERKLLELAVLRLRTLQRFGDTIDDAQDCIAALGQGKTTLLITANTNGVLEVYDNDRYGLLGALDSIDIGASADAGGLRVATNGTRIMAIGCDSGSVDTVTDTSDDGGATWTARTAFDTTFADADWLLWDDANSVFIACGSATIFSRSANGTTWTALSNTDEPRSECRLACLTAGPVLGVKATAVFSTSADAATWTLTGGTVANAADLGSIVDQSICGCLDTFFHLGRIASGALQVSSSQDGATWVTLATITPVSVGLTDFETNRPYILQCPDTGLLVIASPANGGTRTVLFASMNGADWVGPQVLPPEFDPDFITVANGRVFAKAGDQMLASDGIGSV